MRLGEEFQDAQDVGVLIRVLNISSMADAERILERYYPSERYPAKARYMLEELIGRAH